MTRDEHRAKCIEAIADELEPDWRRLQKIDWAHGIVVLRKAARIFDSLHDIARVVIVGAVMRATIRQDGNFDVCTNEVDLTNPPESKP
jgi:hypothetical protein